MPCTRISGVSSSPEALGNLVQLLAAQLAIEKRPISTIDVDQVLNASKAKAENANRKPRERTPTVLSMPFTKS